MELGEKLRQARLEAGLSQRQLCGDIITRNMLSLIEHGSAKPSMETLKLLAARLGKSVSYFLEEDALTSPNHTVMERARRLYDGGQFDAAQQQLEAYREPDPVYDREKALLQNLVLLELAEQAIREGRERYARELLSRCAGAGGYCRESLEHRRLLLLGRLPGQKVAEQLPSLDTELILRGKEALEAGAADRAARLLDAAEDRTGPEWNLLRGRSFLETGEFRKAAEHLHKAEKDFEKETAALLEKCYRELEDYRRAYEYACRQR